MHTLEETAKELNSGVNISLVLASAWILNNVYNRHALAPVKIHQYSSDQNHGSYHNDLIDAILSRATGDQIGGAKTKIILENSHEMGNAVMENLESTSPPIYIYKAIWFVDSLTSFEYLVNDLVNVETLYYRDGFFSLIYTGQESDPLITIRSMFRRLFEIYVINVNVIVYIGEELLAYTYFPFKPLHCHSSKPELYVSFDGIKENASFEIGKLFFPRKLRNMYKCELYSLVLEYKPFIIVDRDKLSREVLRVHGIEGSLLALMAERLNFSLITTVSTFRGTLYRNGTVTGSLKEVIDGNVNMTYAGFTQTQLRDQYMWATNSYLATTVVMAVSTGKPLTSWQRLVKPFKYMIWSCLSSSVLLGVIIIFTLKFLRRPFIESFVFGFHNRTPFTNLWNVLYGGPIDNLPVRNFGRYILAVWMLYTFVLRNAYSGALFRMLQDGHARSTPRTIDEVLKNNYSIIPTPLIKYTFDPKNIAIQGKRTFKHLIAELQIPESKLVVPVDDLYIFYYNQIEPDVDRHLHYLDDFNTMLPITIYLREHSYLYNDFNSLILDLIAYGYISKFMNLYIGPKSPKTAQAPIKLTVEILWAIFGIYLILIALCAIMFSLEMLSKRFAFLSSFLDFLNC